MAALTALLCLAACVCAAEPAFGAIASGDCPVGSALATVTLTWPGSGAGGEVLTAFCPPAKPTCLNGGGGVQLMLSGAPGASTRDFIQGRSTVQSASRWRSPVDFSVSWSASPRALLSVGFTSRDPAASDKVQFSHFRVDTTGDAHALWPTVDLHAAPSWDGYVASGRASYDGSKTSYFDPSGPALSDDTAFIGAVNWTLSLRSTSLHFGYNGFTDVMVLKTRQDVWPRLDDGWVRPHLGPGLILPTVALAVCVPKIRPWSTRHDLRDEDRGLPSRCGRHGHGGQREAEERYAICLCAQVDKFAAAARPGAIA